ncbi:ABC transporter substrate-binding protein [Phycisphaerales bacterium AB-hyl4]|uniref:ABC transporter substrate-binding protein n=1 Tax=Natronomicrosphaera hydrolytica TaxID=3242702 RepID=A0ABV4UAT7_9BACT
MREHLSKIVIVALLVLVVGVPFVLRPGAADTGDEAAGDDAARLIIVSPHNEQIRFEVSRAFNAWRVEQGRSPVRFDWRVSGGTSELRRTVFSQFEAAAAEGREEQGIGADLFFGGGDFEHNQLARGIRVTRDGETFDLPLVVPIELPEGMLEAVYPEPTIGGERLYHPELYWVGPAMASFGIVYNRDLLGMLSLDEPSTWADLTDPSYQGWVALADPGHSGSIAATYNVILRRSGWTEGWALLRRVFANARYFTSSAGKVPTDVSAGEAAAGMAIDFYGRFQAGAINQLGEDRLGYVDPQYMTATTADPIAILRGAPHHALAQEFVAWLLTPRAQRLWQRELGAFDGPVRFELRRQPARRSMYTDDERAYWTDPEIDPFGTARPLPAGTPDYYGMVAPVAHAMAIDIHNDLVAAWRTIQRTPRDHPNRGRMLELFDRLPEELMLVWQSDELADSWQAVMEDETHEQHDEVVATLEAFGAGLRANYGGSANADRLLDARLRWTLFFRENYREIVRLGR